MSEQSDYEYAILDATIIKANQYSAGKKEIEPLGDAEADLRLKYIHPTDVLDNPAVLYLMGGTANDLCESDEFLDVIIS